MMKRRKRASARFSLGELSSEEFRIVLGRNLPMTLTSWAESEIVTRGIGLAILLAFSSKLNY
jgi:hypothetical protein